MSNKEIRKRYLGNLITEGVILALWEQEQAAQPPAQPPVASSVPPATQPTQEPAPVVPNQAQAPQQTQQQPMTLDHMIERLNVVRGGRSFMDPEVYGLLTGFFKKLTDNDKVVIDKFLRELARIVINVDQQEANISDQNQENQAAPPPNSQAPQTGQEPVAQPPIAPSTTPNPVM